MSGLYNAVFGYNPLCQILLGSLNYTGIVPRFRDCLLTPDRQQIILYTRTGGPNREMFAVENAALRKIDGFIRDEDDPVDDSYAYWYYSIPSWTKEAIEKIVQMAPEAVNPKMPHERVQDVLAALKSGVVTPETERARGIGHDLMKLFDERTTDNG